MAKDIPFCFKPDQHALRKIIGPLEHAIMQLIWTTPHSTVRDVHARMQQIPAQKPVALTTILTTMIHMTDKGLLTRSEGTQPHTYAPTYSPDELTTLMIQQVVDSLAQDYPDQTIDYLTDYLTRHPHRCAPTSSISNEKPG